MANVIFLEQRADNGDGIFSEQPQADTQNIEVVLTSQSILTATAEFFAENIFCNLSSASAITATLGFVAREFSAVLSSSSSLTATLIPAISPISAELKASSSITATLYRSISFAAHLTSSSTITATLQAIAQPPVSIQAALVSQSQIIATLFASISNIPKEARVRAAVLDQDTTEIVRFRGDTCADTFLVYDYRNGLPLDISGCSFKLSISATKAPALAADVIYTLYGSVDSPEKGLVHFSPTVAQADRVGYFYYDVEMTDSRGVVKTLISSTYVYQQDITK